MMKNSRKLETFFIMEKIMKKQIIAAAVAASVSAVALADVSITGAAKVNYTYSDKEAANTDTNQFKKEMDLKILGKTGDTSVVMNFGGGQFDSTDNATGGGTINLEDNYLTTKVGDVNLKVGTWDNGNNELRTSARNDGKFAASTSVGGFDLTYNAGDAAADETWVVATSMGPVSVSYEQKQTGETIKASAAMGGVNVKYLGLPTDGAGEDRDYIELSGKIADIAVKVGQANADTNTTISGDSWLGDFEGTGADGAGNSGAYDLDDGNDITGIELSSSVAGNAVTFRNIQVSDDDGSVSKDVSINKIIVTRPLASGATFEFTYTDTDSDVANEDSTVFDLELAVKF